MRLDHRKSQNAAIEVDSEQGLAGKYQSSVLVFTWAEGHQHTRPDRTTRIVTDAMCNKTERKGKRKSETTLRKITLTNQPP